MKYIFPYLVLLISFGLAGTAAYYSIFGLSRLFSASAFAVTIMASILEISKLITASYLHRFWNMITRLMKIYLVSAVCILMFITSLGIYGFLISAYQKTANKLENIDKLIETVEFKKQRFQIQLTDIRTEKDQITKTIKELNSKQGIQNQYTDTNGNIVRYTDRRTANAVNVEVKRNANVRDKLYEKESVLNDSITKLDLKILDLKTNNEVAAEVGPLRYISDITGKSMDIVVNWFVLLFIMVFDPLAVILLIAANRIILNNRKQNELQLVTKTTIQQEQVIPEESKPVEDVVEQEQLEPQAKSEPQRKHLSQAWRTSARKR
tara:strand:+ start:779 stop:1744 length:966 start_codon:yes stop_codon:yes gene_type:complete